MGKNIKSKRKGINNRSRTRRQQGGTVFNPDSSSYLNIASSADTKGGIFTSTAPFASLSGIPASLTGTSANATTATATSTPAAATISGNPGYLHIGTTATGNNPTLDNKHGYLTTTISGNPGYLHIGTTATGNNPTLDNKHGYLTTTTGNNTTATTSTLGTGNSTETNVTPQAPLVLAKIAINIELFDGIKLNPFTIGCFRNFKQYGSPHTELIFNDVLSKSSVNEISRFADCFQNVELLDLRNTKITKLPMNFSKLISLKYLLLPENIISNNFYDLAVKVQTLRYIEVPGFFEKEKTRIEKKIIKTKMNTNEELELTQEQKLTDKELDKTLTEITTLEEKIKVYTGEAIDIDNILYLFNKDDKEKLKKIKRPLAIYNEDKLKKDVIRILSNKKTELKIKNFRIPPDDSDSPVQESVDSGIIFEAPSLLEQFREDPVKKQDIQIAKILAKNLAKSESESEVLPNMNNILYFPPSWPENYEPSLIVSSEKESIYAEQDA